MLLCKRRKCTHQFVFLHVDPLKFGTALRQCYHTLITDIVALPKMYVFQLWAVFTQLQRAGENNSMIMSSKQEQKSIIWSSNSVIPSSQQEEFFQSITIKQTMFKLTKVVEE